MKNIIKKLLLGVLVVSTIGFTAYEYAAKEVTEDQMDIYTTEKKEEILSYLSIIKNPRLDVPRVNVNEAGMMIDGDLSVYTDEEAIAINTTIDMALASHITPFLQRVQNDKEHNIYAWGRCSTYTDTSLLGFELSLEALEIIRNSHGSFGTDLINVFDKYSSIGEQTKVSTSFYGSVPVRKISEAVVLNAEGVYISMYLNDNKVVYVKLPEGTDAYEYTSYWYEGINPPIIEDDEYIIRLEQDFTMIYEKVSDTAYYIRNED